jgi:hypothetical protein
MDLKKRFLGYFLKGLGERMEQTQLADLDYGEKVFADVKP